MQEYFVAWWNLENLFDVNNYAGRSKKLRGKLENELVGWTAKRLTMKIAQISKIIKQMNNNQGPDILGVCEIENKRVLKRLVANLTSLGRKYKIIHHDMSDKRGIDIAFLYDDKKFSFDRWFSYEVLKRSATRDIFQVNLKTKSSGHNLIVIGNHWPARSNGVLETEPYRIIAAETLSYWHSRILEETKNENESILVMGDFNDEPHDRSLTDYALSTNSVLKVLKAATAPRFYNLMWYLMGRGLGTHYYNNFPNMLDQFMISRGFLVKDGPFTIKRNSVSIIRNKEMIKGSYKIPRAFGRPAKNNLDVKGFSDHFPISVILQES